MEVGGWVQVSLGIFLFENRSKIAITSDILEYYTMCILSVHTLQKVVVYYDLSVLSMSVMGFQKEIGWWVGGWVGGVSSIQFFWGFLEFV